MKLGETPINPFTGQGTEGMTLRQYYAGLAMQGIIASLDGRAEKSDIAAVSVEMADALLKELEK